MKRNSTFLLLFVFLFSLSLHAKPWNRVNDIRELRDAGAVEYRFSSLPIAGKSKKKVWTAYHYPFKTGGTVKALRKLEKISPMSRGAVKWEQAFNEKNKQYKWGGHCNGLAVAGIVEPEPTKSVTISGVTFTKEDVQALLMEIYNGPMPVVGDRCNKEKFAVDQFGRVKADECEDINAGTFHLAIGNYLGLRGEAIIIDIRSTSVVWNWPADVYRSKINKVSMKKALSLLGASSLSTYSFNSQAKEFYHVKTLLKTKQNKDQNYEYIVEVDADGKIIGGEWVGNSRKVHPDFIWRPDGFSLDNPYVNIWDILDIAIKSK